MRPPRRLKFTREGKFFVGITLGVGFAAINTANNLLYLLLGMLLALIVVSGVMSELSLRDLTVVRRLPLRAQVGRAHLVEIEVFNHKGKVPSYAIEVEDLRAGQPADKRCFFLKISPRSAQVAAYRRTPVKRGRDHHIGFPDRDALSVRPLREVARGSRRRRAHHLPRGRPRAAPAHQRGQEHAGGEGSAGRGHGEDFLGLKIMRHGEDPRDIHWRKTAAVGQLVMRERARETRPEVRIPLDVMKPDGEKEDWDHGFERRIRDVASRAVAHLKRGDNVTIATSTGATVRGDRTAGADPILRFLALVETVPREGAAIVTAGGGAPLAAEEGGGGVRFGIVHRVMTDALATLGILAVVSTTSMSPWTNAVLLVGLGGALCIPESWQAKPALRHFSNAAPVALFVAQAVRLLAGRPPLDVAVEFAAILQIIRLATRRGAAHDQQIIVLSLLHFVAGTVLGGGLTYGLCFLGFLVVAPGALVLSHLRREVEGNYRQGARDRTGHPVDVPRILRSRRVVGRTFLAIDVSPCRSPSSSSPRRSSFSFRAWGCRSCSSTTRTRGAWSGSPTTSTSGTSASCGATPRSLFASRCPTSPIPRRRG